MPKKDADKPIIRIGAETYELLEKFAEVLGVPIEGLVAQMIEEQMQQAARRNPELARVMLLHRRP